MLDTRQAIGPVAAVYRDCARQLLSVRRGSSQTDTSAEWIFKCGRPQDTSICRTVGPRRCGGLLGHHVPRYHSWRLAGGLDESSRGPPYWQYESSPFLVNGPVATRAGLGRFQGQTTSYNALHTMVQRHYSSGISFVGSYTWSHAIDLESREPSATMIQDPRSC